MSTQGEHIRVIPDTLNNLIVAVSRGEYRIPQFQREFVWERTKVIELFDSIYKEYPIGSFFLWKAGRQHNQLFRHSADLGVRSIRDDDDICFILDGQQRITSLYVTLMGMRVNGTDYSRICFDARDERFTYHQPDGRRFIRVCDIWGDRALEIVEDVEKPYKPAFRRCFAVLHTYPISIVLVSDKELPDVCKIFQRINQAGKRLGRFDLISAMTFTPDFDLREKFRHDISEKLVQKGFGPISPAIVTQLMALVKRGACTESVEYSLTSDEIQEMWKPVVDAVLLAADTLRKTVGVMNSHYLPYDATLTLLAYCYASSPRRSLSEQQLAWVERWFWRASFSQHYGSGGATKMGRDKELFDRLLNGEFPAFEPAMNLDANTLVNTKMTWSRSAARNAFLCLLARRRPVHLANNSALDLVNGSISDFTNPEKHHIFPQAFLRRAGFAALDTHALPNFCFLPGELNRRILDTQPSVYVPELRAQNPHFAEAAQAQIIPVHPGSGLTEDDYLQFLNVRSQSIMEEIERLTGISTAPRADERQKAVERLETRLRDLIHSTLVRAYDGPSYWRRAVPEDIRAEAEKRIASEVRKQPELTADTFADPRRKLDFCNVSDYRTIIQLRSNWPHFEAVFRRRADFEHHMAKFSEFRNALMHNRPLTEIGRREGDVAVIWLSTVLPSQNGEEPQDEDEQPDE